jgi:23S rRNA pseudouridine1911/1915/1917 synthase
LRALIDDGKVTVQGKAVKPALRLSGGEEIVLTVPPPIPAEPAAEELPLRFLYQDGDVAVVDKPPGLVVHPAAGHAQGTLVNALLFHLKDLGGVGGELRPGIVHRLDKDTSGCLVVAKNERALAGLQAAFKSRTVEKIYLALVHGSPPETQRIETLYGRHPVHRKRFTARLKEGKPALTEFRVRERFDGAALLEVQLFTGRTHQIRVHLAEAGFPLLGEKIYAPKKPKGRVGEVQAALGRQALHAWRLAFPHPRTGKRISLEAPIPDDLTRAIAGLRG